MSRFVRDVVCDGGILIFLYFVFFFVFDLALPSPHPTYPLTTLNFSASPLKKQSRQIKNLASNAMKKPK